MSRRELFVLGGIVLALNSAHWAVSFSVSDRTVQLAQAAKVVEGSKECKVGDFEVATKNTIGVQECERGAEYEISAWRSLNASEGTLHVKTTKCPPPAPLAPQGVNANVWQKQWELKQPEGIVRMKTLRRGETLVTLCDKTFGDPVKSLVAKGSVYEPIGSSKQPALPVLSSAGSPEDTWTRGAPSSGGIGDAFEPLSPDFQNPSDYPEFKSIDQDIADLARESNARDPRIEDAARQFSAYSRSALGDSPYIGVESERTLGQSLNDTVRDAVRENTSNAIAERYMAEGTGFEVTRVEGGAVTTVWSPNASEKFYDNESATVWLERPPAQTDLVIHTPAGNEVRTSPDDSSWTWALFAIDSPEKFSIFEKHYFDGGVEPRSFELTSVNSGTQESRSVEGDFLGTEMPLLTESVLVREIGGDTRVISRDVFDAVRWQGDIAYGVDGIQNRVARDTNNKVTFDAPFSFAGESGVGGKTEPSYALTQLSSQGRATALSLIEGELDKYPREYWDTANPGTIYTYKARPGMESRVKSGGYSSNYGGHMWLRGEIALSDPEHFAGSVDHELAHYNDNRTFVSDRTFGQEVYGSSYGRAYAGETGTDALLSGKLGYGRPEGFARDYGYQGGVAEDKATIVEAMFKNYPAVQRAMWGDPVLTRKVEILKFGFSQATKGAMGESYWNNLRPIDATYQLPSTISKPNLVQSVVSKLGVK